MLGLLNWRSDCDASNPEACAVAGYIYEDGKGTKPDAEKGEARVKKACDMGYRWACKPRSTK